jgi:predicted outer membrane repeat protein
MTGTLVKSNTSTGTTTGLGGGIANAGNGAVAIVSCTVEDNFAATTGGGFSDENNETGTLSVSNSRFVNNSALGDGGAIFVSSGVGMNVTPTLSNTIFEGNVSNASGGGLCDFVGVMTITNCTFSSNAAGTNGGGIEGPLTTGLTILNSTIAGNNALNNAGGADGGGIDAPFGAVDLINDTITGNFADNGGGVFWKGTFPFNVQNTIIAKNIASTAGPDADNPSGTFTDRGGNLIGIAGTGSGNTGFTAATTQKGTLASPLDPLLGPLQNNGGPTVGAPASPGTLGTEVPLAGSPVIDKGVTDFLFVDERGYLRPDEGNGDPADVGAVEFLTSQERFVQALYLDELGRPGTLAELDSWVTVLNGPGGRAAVSADLAGSLEARDHLVKGWYQTYLGRPAMNGEEGIWAVMLQTQTEEQVLSQILATPEFGFHAQTLGFTGSADAQFVQALYLLLFNRAGGPSEVAMWVGALPTLGRQQVAQIFLKTPEYRADVVEGYYVTLLHHQPDPVGVSAWVTSGLDLATIRVDFESSGEFFNVG